MNPSPYRMTRARARWMGVLAILPVVLMALMFIAFFGVMMSLGMRQGGPPPGEPPRFLLALFPLQCLLMVLWVTSLVLHVVDVFRNPHVADNLRVVWALLFFFMGMFTLPVYWFLYVWQPSRTLPAEAGGP